MSVGGTLVIAQHSEPKTLNPLVAIDDNSRKIVRLIQADLLHINRLTQQVEPALAERWNISKDGRLFTIHLRRGLHFSDGSPCNADDVVFTFESLIDPRVASPQRDMLVIGGTPIEVHKIDDLTVVFKMRAPYAAAERLFDGIAILPHRLLAASAHAGKLASVWGLDANASKIIGTGPFRFKEYLPGQRIVLVRNPFYWKKDSAGRQLPYLDRIVSVLTPNANAEAMQFDAGEIDIISDISPSGFDSLQRDGPRRHFRLFDLGPGLEYVFLTFNQNAGASAASQAIGRKQQWFRQVAFRRAVSEAIDRQAIVKLAYFGRASPLATVVTPAYKHWIDHSIPEPTVALGRSREDLKQAGFSWNPQGALQDPSGARVEFSLLINAGKPQQIRMAALIQQDLKLLGIQIEIEPLEFQTYLDSLMNTLKYEAALVTLVGGDPDPNSEMGLLTSTGALHFWDRQPAGSLEPWQKQIDALMRQQMITLDYAKRKKIYDSVQHILWENVPMVCLISPHILIGAKDRVGNFDPALMSDYTLWNADVLFVRR